MQVWVVLETYPYEGSEVVGVHSTEATADVEAKRLGDKEDWRNVDYRVKAFEVQQ
jgi:hypothetical protein